MVRTMSEMVIATNVIDLAAYRAAREAKRRRVVPTEYQMWYPGAGELGHDTVVVPAPH
jgi:hypothetical protein